MDPQMPTSFIPKRPVSSEAVSTPHRSVGILSLIATICVIATALSFGGVYLYSKQLDSQKIKVEQAINEAKNGIGTDFVADMKRLSARIEGVKALVASHIVVSPIFAALEDTTLRSIQYKNFEYAFTNDPTTKERVVVVTLTGVAKSYTTIALQSDAFAQSTIIKNPVFSQLAVDEKTGTINFTLSFNVSPSDLSFEAFVKSLTT